MSPTVHAYSVVASQESDNLVSNSGPGCAPLDGYSELMSNTGLGTIPCRTQLLISANGKTIQAGKCDSGLGSSFNPVMGLYPRVSEYLFGTRNGGEFHVTIQRPDGGPINVRGGTPTNPVNGVRASGGTAALGGSGTLLNSITSPQQPNFQVGDVLNPDEDYWSAIQRLSQQRYWYCFSDGETLYLADGPDLMRQTPAVKIDRIADGGQIALLTMQFDNTAFQYSVNHHKRRRTQRRTMLAKVTSPTEGEIDLICKVDEVRAGDVVSLSSVGPMDGKWLAGDVRRSVFQVTSNITLVTALSPLSEDDIAGVNASNQTPLLPGLSSSTSATVAKAVAAAKTLSNLHLPYLWGGGHNPGGIASDHPGGLDCSGSVCWVLHRAGMFNPTTAIVSGDFSTWGAPGQGKEMTVWFSPNHVFIQFVKLNTQLNTSPGPGPRYIPWGGPGAADAATFGARHWPGT